LSFALDGGVMNIHATINAAITKPARNIILDIPFSRDTKGVCMVCVSYGGVI